MKLPNYVEDVVLMPKSTLEMTSPFKNVKVAFNWLNRDYPVYHEHSHWECLVVMAGKICHNLNGRETILKKGDVCLICPKDKHSLTFVEKNVRDFQHLNFICDNDFMQKFLSMYDCYEEEMEKTETYIYTLDEADIAVLYERALMVQMLPKEQYEACTRLMLSKILIGYLEQRVLYNSDYPEWLNLFLEQLANPINFNQTVEEMSKTVNYSYSRLSRVFKQYMGITIVEYVNEKKMIYSKRLLRSTNLSVLQIAERVGYSSLSSFNHLFKKTYGVTPTEYRKKQKND